MRRDRVDIGRVLASFAALVALVVVVPVGLIAVSSARFGSANPLSGIRNIGGDAGETLTRPLADDTVIDGLVRLALCAAWVALGVIVITTVVEVAHMARHRGLPMPSVRGLSAVQHLARFIAVGLVMLIPMTTATPSIATALSARASPVGGHASAVGIEQEVEHESSAVDERVDEATPMTTHVVRPGESVYSIAQQLAGTNDAAVFGIAESIVEANIGTSMAHGRRFTNPAYVEVGWELRIPSHLVRTPTDTAPESRGDDDYTVQRGDTLWDIADEQLGDPTEWTEIWDANADRDMGSGRTFDDPDLILPGWELDLSDDSGSVVAAATPDVDVATPSARIAVDDAGVPVTTQPHTTPSTRPTTTTAARDTSVPVSRTPAIVPGVPDPVVAATTTSTVAAASSDGDAVGIEDRPTDAPGAPSPLRMEHAALLGAGILALVGVRRRRRLRSAMPRHRVPDPRPEAVATERRLRSVDAGERALRVDVACRAAAWSLVGTGSRIGWIEVTPDGAVGVRLSASADLPAPWTGSGHEWWLPADVPIELLSEDARQVGMPCVALVQLGVTPAGADVMIDVEACATLAVEARPDQADEVITALAAGLASSMYAEVAHLVVVGLEASALLDHRNAHVADSTGAALELARSIVGARADDGRTSFELRSLQTGGEMWEPAVVLVAHGHLLVDTDLGSATGICFVVPSAPDELADAPTRLVSSPDTWTFAGFGSSIELTPVGVSSDDLAAVAGLFADASGALQSIELDAVQWGDDAIGAVRGSDPESSTEQVEAFVAMRHRIVVGLLGGVEIAAADGTRAAFERSKTVELIAWLATHRERATRTGARTALWELDVRDATFANVVSEARRGLARLVGPPVGEEWIARTLTEQLPLHGDVVTDADLVERRLAHARVQTPAQAIETLRPAVTMIRDMPFAGTSYLWPDAEGITSNLVLLAITAAAEFAGHALSLGDTDGVFWATGRGLQVLGGHEELIGLRMRAHAHAGDLAGVRNEWESYERILVADAWSDGEPAPKLLALRRELLS